LTCLFLNVETIPTLLWFDICVCKEKKVVVYLLTYHELTPILCIVPLKTWFLSTIDIFELTSMRFIFPSGTTFCPEDLNWDCKRWKEGPVKCSWNRMLQLFLVMELVTWLGWIDNDGGAPIFIPFFELSEITVIPLGNSIRRKKIRYKFKVISTSYVMNNL